MTLYRVECETVGREVYVVEADTAEEAMERWSDGHLTLSEVTTSEPISASEATP